MALTVDYIERLFDDSEGYTGNVYYFRIVRRGDGKIWDNVNKVLSDTPTWVNTAILMAEKGTTGQYSILIPIANGLPQGHTYEITIYKRATGTALNTDDVQANFETKVGDIFGF